MSREEAHSLKSTLMNSACVAAALLFAGVAVCGSPKFKSEPTPANVFKAAQTKLTQQKRNCLVEKQPDFWRKIPMRDGGYAYQFAQQAKSSLSGQIDEGDCNSEETYFIPSGEVSVYNGCLNAQPKGGLKGDSLSDKQRQTFADIKTCEGLTVPMPEVVRQSFETCAQQQTGMHVEMMGGLPTMTIAVGPASRPDEQVVYAYRWSKTEDKANKTPLQKLEGAAVITDVTRLKLEGCMSQAGMTNYALQ